MPSSSGATDSVNIGIGGRTVVPYMSSSQPTLLRSSPALVFHSYLSRDALQEFSSGGYEEHSVSFVA